MNSPRFKVSAFNSIATPRLNAKKSNVLFSTPAESLNAFNGTADVLFLDECKKSRNLSDLCFCNYLPKFIRHTEIDEVISDLLGKPNILISNLQSINFDYQNGDRIKQVLLNVLGNELTEKYLNFIYEKRLNSKMSITQKGKTRVFSFYSVINEGKKSRNILIVFLFDPFHLVCPVATKKETKNQAMKNEYNTCCKFNKSFTDFFENQFNKVKFIKKQTIIEELEDTK